VGVVESAARLFAHLSALDRSAINMAKIVLTYEYEPNLDHYPAGTDTAADAMRHDVQQVQNGEALWDEFFDGPGTLTVEVVD
jgi:hypothetical protein